MKILLRIGHLASTGVLAAATAGTPQLADAACNVVNGKAYGDCTGVTVNHGAKAALKVSGALSENGIASGATVFSGGSLHLSGISNGDITIHRGGRLSVTGVVNGTVRNLGGTVEIEGTVDHLFSIGGNVNVAGVVGSVSGPGPVEFHHGSVLGGTPFEVGTSRPGKK